MKVQFVCPAIGRFEGSRDYIRSWEMKPLALGVLSALTPDTWDRTLVDDRLEEIDYDQPADLVAITVETYSARRSYQIAAEFRKRGVPVIMGGYHPTLCTDETLEHTDSVCVGRAESVWPRVLADVAEGDIQRVYQAATSETIPWVTPDDGLFAGKNYVKLAMVETSRGCPHRCRFCSITSFYESSFERRPPQEVVAELSATKAKTVFFVDDNFAGDRQGTLELLAAIKPLKRRWMTQVSMHVASDAVLLDAMAESGCMGALIGFESTDPAAVEQMGKAVNRRGQYEGVVREFTRRKIAVYGTFLFGYDGDNDVRREHEIEFAVKEGLFMAAFNHIVPFPGTALYDELRESGRLLDDRWWLAEDYRFGMLAYQPTEGTPRAVEHACQAARRRLYSLANIARRARHIQFFANMMINQATFWAINLMMRREQVRFGWPLGLVKKQSPSEPYRRRRFEMGMAERSSPIDAECRELLSQCGMTGAIEKVATAEPSFFDSLAVLGKYQRVWTLRDCARLGRLVGMGVLAEKPAWIGGERVATGYLTLLRIHPDYQRRGLTAFGYGGFVEHLGGDVPSVCLTAIFNDNVRAIATLAAGRRGVPTYTPVAALITLITGAGQHRRLRDYDGALSLSRCSEADLDELLAFWRERAQQHTMMPAYERKDFGPGGLLAGLAISDVVIGRKEGEIVACVGLWDQRGLRQFRVERYNRLLRLAKPGIDLALKLAGLPGMPITGESMNLRQLAITAWTDDRAFEAAVKRLLAEIDDPQTIVAATKCCDDPIWKSLSRLRGMKQGSTLYRVDLGGEQMPLPTQKLYIEGGSL
jgi:radical SAM superfamily enzyme YgiQ (UPF0313 family)